jgi:hypothetical protein
MLLIGIARVDSGLLNRFSEKTLNFTTQMTNMKNKVMAMIIGFIAFQSIAQDTTWVQTFTFDSISTRRANFQFPANLDTSRFERVLMYYKLKCSPLTTWDSYNCGEWDYLTYTRILDHTGVMDSVEVLGNRYRINTLSPANYSYSNSVYFDQQEQQVERRTPVSSNTFALNGTTAIPFSFVNPQSNGRAMQWIISQQYLISSGVTAGNIQGIDLSFLAGISHLENVVIRMKSTTLTTLTSFETSGFTTVFNDELTVLNPGNQNIHFALPFYFDGVQNIVIEISYSDAHLGLNGVDLATISSGNTLVYDNANGIFETTASNFAEVNMNNVDLGGDITIAFWAKGNGSYGTNTSILEAVDSTNTRILNIHMPWSDNTIYFDAGNQNGYDRISKAAQATDIDNTWHHWAFVKKTSTGEMKIYKDGVLWHSGANLNRLIGKVDRFFLGSNWNQAYQYKGTIDEFSVWTSALDAATIAQWKDKKIDPTHPNFASLELYYDFDGQRAMIDRSGHNRLGMCSDVTMVNHASNPISGVVNYPGVPAIGFIQGTYNSPVTTTISTALFPDISVKFEYAPAANSFTIVSNELTYDTPTIDTFDVANNVIGSALSNLNLQLTNQTISYFKPPFELVNDIEIGRYITPYGIGFDLGPQGFTWIYDVTDYQQYLKGNVDLAAHNTQELIDLKFAFVAGIPSRDVHNITPIWSNFKSYNYAEMANDVVLSEKPMILSDTSEMFKIKTRFSGHGQVGDAACCEWAAKDHQLIVDGIPRFTWNIWRENACGENPNIKQGGTWVYAREGWCPGDLVPEFEHELTSFVSPGDTVLIDYDISDVPVDDPGQAGGNYIVAMDLVSYSSPNFQHDAGIADVLNPNNWEYYSKWNPTCSNPRIVLQNNGSEPLTNCVIRCWVTYGVWAEVNWTGNLNFLEKEIVEIPIADVNWWFGANSDSRFHAQVYAVEGYPDLDEYAQNNHFSTKYAAPELIDGPFYIWMTTNNKANENQWKLIDGTGAIIFQRTALTNSTDYKDTFDLAPGCYSIILEDSDHDGLNFWYSQQTEGETAGAFRVRKVSGSMMEIFPGDFGKYHQYDFTVGFTLDSPNNELNDEMMLFPNPASDLVRMEYVGNLGPKVLVEMLDMNGRVVFQQSIQNTNNSYGQDILLSTIENGYYLVRVIGELGMRTTPFVKQ